MGVTSVSAAAQGARPVDMQGEGLELPAGMIGRPVEGGAPGSVMGGGRCEVETGESVHMGEVLQAAEKAELASAAADTAALGFEWPPPPPLRGCPQVDFNRKQGGDAATGAGAQQAEVGLPIADSMPGAWPGAGSRAPWRPADSTALPDPGEEAGLSKVDRAEGSEGEEVPGRGCDWEGRGPGELCFLCHKGCPTLAAPAVSRMVSGPMVSWTFLRFPHSEVMLGARGTAGGGAVAAAGTGTEQEGWVVPWSLTASVSPRRALSMVRSAASFSEARSSTVTRKPSSGAGGSLRGAPCLLGSRGVLRFRGLDLSGVGEQMLWVSVCPGVGSASFPRCVFLWESPEPAEGDPRPSGITFSEGLWGSQVWAVAGPILLCTDGNPRVELYELVMAFLLGQELMHEVWDFWMDLSSGLMLWWVPCRGPGLGTMEQRPPCSPSGLNADDASPGLSGPLPSSSCLSMTGGSSSCSAVSFLLSPGVLNSIFSVLGS